MPGLLAVSWARGRKVQANELFEELCEGFSRLKGLGCNSHVRTTGFRIARFAGARSPYPDVVHGTPSHLIAASAGWWCEHGTERLRPPGLGDLINQYERKPDHVFDQLFGQYLIALIDTHHGKLMASADRLGFFPSYVAEQDGIVWLSTSSAALASVLKPDLDIPAVRALFMGDAIRSPRTAFEGIRRLAFGEQVTFADGKSKIERVWVPYRPTKSYRRIEEAAEEGVAVLRKCSRAIVQRFPEPVCDLTSGLDSRLVVSALAEPGVKLNVTVNGDDDHLDVIIASEIAKQFGWTCYRGGRPGDWGQIRWPYFQKAAILTEGELAANLADGVIQLKESLGERFSISLTGGMGEICRDFFWQQELLKIGKSSSVNIDRLCRYRFFFNSRPEMTLFRQAWRSEYIEEQVRAAQQVADIAPDALNTAKLDAVYIWKNSGHAGRYLGASCVVIPIVVPLGLQPFVEFSISVPYRYRMRGNLVRHMISRVDPELAKFPTWYGGSAEPFRVTRPREYLPYLVNLFKKGVRKAGQLAIHKPLFKDPCAHRVDPTHDTDFVRTLKNEGYLDINNLTTASLYDPDGLRKFLQEASNPTFKSFSQFYAIMSLEVLCRETGITPSGQSL